LLELNIEYKIVVWYGLKCNCAD